MKRVWFVKSNDRDHRWWRWWGWTWEESSIKGKLHTTITQPLDKLQARRDSNASDVSDGGEQKKNQFSFVERATQTKNNALKVVHCIPKLSILRSVGRLVGLQRLALMKHRALSI